MSYNEVYEKIGNTQSLLRSLLSAWPVRQLTRFITKTIHFAGRIASFARARMLFPNSNIVLHWSTEVKYPENITLGRNIVIGPNCTIGAAAPISFGDDVHVSKGVFVETGTQDVDVSLPPYNSIKKPIRIGNGVWLGANAIILAGVNVGDNSVVSAGAVVRKNVPANTIVSSARNIYQSLEMLDRQPVVSK